MLTRDYHSAFWNYLSQAQKDLILEGDYLMYDIVEDCKYSFKDYSFLVFPYAKTYEGFLKQLAYDSGFIGHLDYISDHLRMGKLLSPFLVGRLGDKSLYRRIKEYTTKELAEQAWYTWRNGRNQVFHYFPHNLKSISFEEAGTINANIISTMEKLYQEIYLPIQAAKEHVTVEQLVQ
ncbi:hypothetical protein HGA88_00340 [Candidatus Roizmanbacteria bacterium]|nr:hypothetical protein [Candidatus Roizmanbacteria bacterium]